MKILIAIIQSILTFLGIGFIAIIFYSELPLPYNWILFLITIGIAIYFTIRVYKKLRRQGYISTISEVHSSPELDNLKPGTESEVIKLTPLEFTGKFKREEISLEKATIAIWGDCKGRQLNTKHQISTVAFNANQAMLLIYFTDNCQLQIKKPSYIYYTSSYLKIIKAKEIKWLVKKNNRLVNNYHYHMVTNKIKTTSNTNWKPMPEDVGIGMNALYLQI